MTTRKYNEFVKQYSKRTAGVIRYLAKGWTNQRIAKRFNITTASVGTYKANLTRGAYYPFVDISPTKGIFFV